MLYKFHPALFLSLLLLPPFVFAVLVLATRRKAVLWVSLCKRHRRRRFGVMTAGWLACAGGFILLCVAASIDYLPLLAAAIVFIVGGAAVASWGSRILSAKKIDEWLVWAEGAGDEYLDSLPPMPVPYERVTRYYPIADRR